MFLTIRSETRPAGNLSFLLHKHPDKLQRFELNFGIATVFYPRCDDEVCEAALYVAIDPVGLARSRNLPRGNAATLRHYVNDRPYAASSFLSVAIAQVFGTALAGRCKERPEAVERELDLTISLPAVPSRHGEDLLVRLFEPLGYRLQMQQIPLDEKFPDWDESHYFSLQLAGRRRLRDALRHLYVLIPVLDNEKHYWVSENELEKLLAKGEGWLDSHPEKQLIVRRYLRYRRELIGAAIEQLAPDVQAAESGEPELDEDEAERRLSLNEQRLGTALAALKACGTKSVIDIGCGEGSLLKLLLEEPQFEKISGMDASCRALEGARRRLRYDRLPPFKKERIELFQGSVIYRDSRLSGFDAAAILEVVEHLDPPRLDAFERVIFEFAKPETVVLTTPNREYNINWPRLPGGNFRHRDHRFEWTRHEFQQWAEKISARFGYNVRFLSVGPEEAGTGPPTQMGIFQRQN